jgi:hypothetical protein
MRSLNVNAEAIQAVKRIFRHVQGCKHDVQIYRRNPAGLQAEMKVDADFGGEPQENLRPMRSITGLIIYFAACGLLENCSKLQNYITKSTFEAEYVAVGIACQKAQGWLNLFKELKLPIKMQFKIYNDNRSTIQTFHNKTQSMRTRQIAIEYHYGREMIRKGAVQLEYIPSGENTADINTKALPQVTYNRHAENIQVNL